MSTNPAELEVFHEYLTMDAPSGYKPHYFKCNPLGKDPIERISWKAQYARLTIADAVKWMGRGGNVGIAGMEYDPLTIVDLDGGKVTWDIDTLRDRSGSRCGSHCYTFSANPKIPNIDTDDYGEVRSQAQYVIAPGSFIEITKPNPKKPCPPGEEANLGKYTVELPRPVKWITYEDLPEVFRNTHLADLKAEAEAVPLATRSGVKHLRDGPHSALFDLQVSDIITRFGGSTIPGKRWASIIHDSSTEANMSYSKEGLAHCWRHNVSLNAIQLLTALSGYMSCGDAGTPHKGTAGRSRVTGDDGAILAAWLYAKKRGLIPESDPIPVRALNHIARKHLGFKAVAGQLLPRAVYTRTLEIAEREY